MLFHGQSVIHMSAQVADSRSLESGIRSCNKFVRLHNRISRSPKSCGARYGALTILPALRIRMVALVLSRADGRGDRKSDELDRQRPRTNFRKISWRL